MNEYFGQFLDVVLVRGKGNATSQFLELGRQTPCGWGQHEEVPVARARDLAGREGGRDWDFPEARGCP